MLDNGPNTVLKYTLKALRRMLFPPTISLSVRAEINAKEVVQKSAKVDEAERSIQPWTALTQRPWRKFTAIST